MAKMKRQVMGFLVAGVTAVCIDAAAYSLFILFGFNSGFSKAASFILGSFFAYAFNKTLSFQAKSRATNDLPKFYALYLCSLGANVFVNEISLSGLSPSWPIHEIAFVFATATSTILNFIGMKFWVFRGHD